ncbi:hypothetical protein PGTUg99_005275 [Puccinia graminis f. sp. tritici]|uniref:Uncharacterized protein n=1 Tax=Puccinia graminis f. sp. tritici TaxID=56615 RepID=A0A5B0RI98_PUCGR|nr:hypothetical protein PGTUg99_005275 [Puccinia graminis f. sp. tritici]
MSSSAATERANLVRKAPNQLSKDYDWSDNAGQGDVSGQRVLSGDRHISENITHDQVMFP